MEAPDYLQCRPLICNSTVGTILRAMTKPATIAELLERPTLLNMEGNLPQ